MIVRERPGPLRLLLAWKGSVVPHILPHIVLTGMFAAAVTWVSRHHYLDGMVDYTLLPFTIMGIALSIFLSVRNTAIVAYTFFGLDRLSEQLEFPFGRHTNDLPLDAICRIHEISVAEALGDPAPEPLQPVKYQLQ
ncbi:hypothetical protein [Marinobacter nauticus]|uniref:hypothetical protein n=1 Tax=Marinobacter nauticus TaxID=2743 RepID=UPI0040440FDE